MDEDDRRRVKREDIASGYTGRPWNTDLPSSHMILLSLVSNVHVHVCTCTYAATGTYMYMYLDVLYVHDIVEA